MVMTTRGSGSGFGLGVDVEAIDERIHEFITPEVTHDILDAAHMMFDTIKYGIMELLDQHLGDFHAEIVNGQLGACTLTF